MTITVKTPFVVVVLLFLLALFFGWPFTPFGTKSKQRQENKQERSHARQQARPAPTHAARQASAHRFSQPIDINAMNDQVSEAFNRGYNRVREQQQAANDAAR